MTRPGGVGVAAGSDTALFLPDPIMTAAGIPITITSSIPITASARGERFFTWTANAKKMLRARAVAARIRTCAARAKMRFRVMRFAFPDTLRVVVDASVDRRFVCRFM